ncbi:aspartate dehydrogenase, partial [Cribrihabitans sp. XS_ASV171]
MNIGIIGEGAIGRYVAETLRGTGLGPRVLLTRSGPVGAAEGVERVRSAAELPGDTDLMVDCAGHAALAQHGPAILERGIDLITVSLGALADPKLEAALTDTARRGGAQLHLASGAIGALDALRAARVGGLETVTYTGRKPPRGW